MYQQIDIILMDHPLGAARAKIFIEYYEDKLFQVTPIRTHYDQYVDKTFTFFSLLITACLKIRLWIWNQ